MSSPQPGLLPPHSIRLSMASATSLSSSSTKYSHSGPPRLNPVTPLESSRYDPVTNPRTTMPPQKLFRAGPWTTGRIDLDCDMLSLGDLPAGWIQYTHLDGKPYFHYPEWGVVTEDYIRDQAIFDRLVQWYQEVNAVRSRLFPDFNSSRKQELYLTLFPKRGYYFVDHANKSVFWLEDLTVEELGYIIHDPARSFGIFIKRNYYRHLEHFPVHNKLPNDAEDLLRCALKYSCTEHMTSRESSTAPWNAQDCKTFLDLLDGDSRDVDSETAGYKTWFVSRLLCNILQSQWVHHYGMYEARTDRLASVQGLQPSTTPSGIVKFIFRTLLFSAPHTYSERIESIWVDRIVSLNDWQKLLTSLLVEWSDSNLLATVTLSANMALLALSDMNAASRTSSIVSSLLAIGSIVIGLHHVWRHREKVDTNASQAATYLENASRPIQSLKLLAFFLSLPLVMLSWSLITFAVSITLFTFGDGRFWWCYAVVGVVLCAVVIVVVSTTYFFWGVFFAHNRSA